jgi:hypothetical protein
MNRNSGIIARIQRVPRLSWEFCLTRIAMVLRSAVPNELSIIQSLNRELCLKEHLEYDSTINPDYPFEDGAEYFASRIEKDFAMIANVDGKDVGYLVGNVRKGPDYRSVEKMAHLENMYVIEGYRSKGGGKSPPRRFLGMGEGKGCGMRAGNRLRIEWPGHRVLPQGGLFGHFLRNGKENLAGNFLRHGIPVRTQRIGHRAFRKGKLRLIEQGERIGILIRVLRATFRKPQTMAKY